MEYNKKYVMTQKEAYSKEFYKDKILLRGGMASIVIKYDVSMQDMFNNFKERNMFEDMNWGYKKPVIENYGYRFIFNSNGKKLIRIDIDWFTFGICKFLDKAMGSDPIKIRGIWKR